MNIGWVFVHGWTGDSCRTFVRIKFLRLVLGVLMLASMSLTVHFIEASQYWAEAGRARKVVTANQNTISDRA